MMFIFRPRIYPNRCGFSEFYLSLRYGKELNYENVSKEDFISVGIRPKFSYAQAEIGLYFEERDKNIFNFTTNNYTRFKDLENFDLWIAAITKKWFHIAMGGEIGDAIYYRGEIQKYNL